MIKTWSLTASESVRVRANYC